MTKIDQHPDGTRLPIQWPFDLVYGNRWPPYSFEVYDENDVLITDHIPRMEFRRSADDATPFKTFAVNTGFKKTGGLTTFDCNVDIKPGEYVHAIIITDSNGHKWTQYEGTVIISKK